MFSKYLRLSLIPVLGLSLIGCNEDDEATPMAPVVEKTITELVVEDARFATLETAVKAAGLAETLSGTGPFTVFAPTNEAFAALPAGTLEALLAAPMGDLKNILLYHVVPGSVKAAAVVTLTKATTVFGKDVTIEVKAGKVILNGSVEVTITDIAAKNGIIHVINGVLLPPADPKTITELVVEDARFATLETAVKAAGLAETLSGTGPFTVFAPTNEAFAALPAGTLEALLAAPMGDLKNILLYHVVPGSVNAAAVVTLTKATTVLGKDVTIEVKAGKVILNGSVEVTITDIAAKNGIIHVINGVLLPPADPKTITEVVVEDVRFATLETAVKAAGLAETLSGAGPFTVFAPTNEAFAALPAGTLEALLAAPMGDLKNILLYHVVPGSVKAAAVVTLTKATTVFGKDVTIEVKAGKVILNGSVEVTITDIAAKNGVIHVIDGVLLPPADAKTITELVVEDARFSTLETAVKAAGLAETLSGAGPFTVFAPTNEAFAALPAGTLEALLAAPMGDLKNILLYHVVPGSVKAAAVVTLTKATTVFGKDVTIEVKAGKVILNGSVEVTVTDIVAKNGVIHVINGVLLPPATM